MSIQRWLLLAGLLGAAACKAATGPNADCSFVDRSDAAATGYQVCSEAPSP
jgi:hypothetical protein